VRLAGDGVGLNDRQELVLNQFDDLTEGLGVTFGVVIKTANKVLTGMLDNLRRQRNRRDKVIRVFRQLQGALVLEFLDDAGLDFGERALRIDEMVMEDVAERLQRLVSALLKDAVTIARGVGRQVGLADFRERSACPRFS
jgi:histone H3/H4